jgi:hypothetical protein
LRHAVDSSRKGGAPGVVMVPSGPTTAAACGGAFSCGSNSCDKQNCGGTNTCDHQTCPTLDCQGKNTCQTQSCDKLRSALTAGAFLNKYASTQFVKELRQMFGSDVERQVDQMLRTKTTLRQRGLVESHAPPAPKPAPGAVQPPLRRSP